MNPRLPSIDLTSWEGLLSFLCAELGAASTDERRALLFESMAFVEYDGLGSADKAWASLEQARGFELERPRALWDAWRLARELPAFEQEDTLSELANLPEPASDAQQRFLRHARFERDALGRFEQFAVRVREARTRWPAGHHSLLAEAESHLLAGRHSDAALALERLARGSDDACVRASLRVEAAWLRKESGSDDDVARLLEEALAEPTSDWMFLRDTLDLSAEIGDWVLHEAALRKMAGAALEPGEQSDAQWPAGHSFDGFERGVAVAAAHWWLVAMVRERRLGRAQSAAEAMERALELCPGHPLLASEHARLLEALGRFDDALASLPENASATRQAELLLLAGRPEAAASIISASNDQGVIARALRDLLGVSPVPDSHQPDELAAWLRAHPEHQGASTAAAMLLHHHDDPVARLVIAETTQERTQWPPSSNEPSPPAWQLASRALTALCDNDAEASRQALLAWADGSTDATLRAVLIAVAARMAEDANDPTRALALYEEAQVLSPQTPAAKLAALRLLLRLGRYTDLVQRLCEHAATSRNQFHSQALLHEAAQLLRHKLGNTAEADRLLTAICQNDSSDVPALWSAFELAFESQDMPRAVELVGRLAEQCPGDADWLRLLAAEIDLLATGDYDDALVQLDRAAESKDESISRAARLYRMLVLYLLGDVTSLDEALQEEALTSPDGHDRMWIPELLEAGRGARGAEAMAELLEADGDTSAVKSLWLLLVGAVSGETSKLTAGLRALANGAPPGEIAGACRTAALVLDPSTNLANEENLNDTDIDSAEVVLHVADRLTPEVAPERRADISLQRAALCRDYDLAEWADWRLEAIEAFEDLGRFEQSLSLVVESLDEQPEHPGLLEAYARIAEAAGAHEASLDARLKLSEFYEEPMERAAQLVRAADIAATGLGRFEDAQRLAEQAIEVDPSCSAAHDALAAIHRKAGDYSGVQRALEGHLASASTSDEQVRLLRELADQKLSEDDVDGCLATIDRLLSIAPSRCDALLTKIEILVDSDRSAEQLRAMDLYIAVEPDLAEARKMAWRASELLSQRLSDRSGAIERLRAIEQRGDPHPDTQRRLVSLYAQEQRWDEAADALHKLASLVPDQEKRLATLYEEARVRLEQMFDDLGASRILDEVLGDQPLHLPSLELASTFRPPDINALVFDRAAQACFADLSEHPTDLTRIGQLAEVARLSGWSDVRSLCDEAVAFFSKVEPVSVLPAIAPAEVSRPVELWPYLSASLREHPASVVATIAAEAAAEAFDGAGRSLQLGRASRLTKRGVSPLRDWLESWALALGMNELELHAGGQSEDGSVCLPGAVPTVAICLDIGREPSAMDQYFAVFNLVRSHQGLGAFAAADHAGPQRWVLAVAAAVLGEATPLPMPTDKELVNRAKKGLSRKARARLEEPSQRLVAQTAASLRAWSADCVSTADRAGLLAAGHLCQTMHALIGQEAGTTGAQLLVSDPQRQLPRLPRGNDLMSFALGGQLVRARRAVTQGPTGNGELR